MSNTDILSRAEAIKADLVYLADSIHNDLLIGRQWTFKLSNDAYDYIRALEARVHELETSHRTEMCDAAGYDCVELGKLRRQIAELTAKTEADPIHAAGGCYCRECRYASEQGGYSSVEEAESCANCTISLTHTHHVLVMPKDGFCSRGIKREEP